MPVQVTPRVILIGETRVDHEGLERMLTHLGCPDWDTDSCSDSELMTEVAGKLCYLSFSTDLNKNLTRANTRTNSDYVKQQIVGAKHGSVLEHSTVNFVFLDVSRVVTHEIVRHRAGTAFSQVSGRYVRTDVITYYMPKILRDIPGAENVFKRAFGAMEDGVRELERLSGIDDLKDFSLKKRLTSAFRRIIGNGQTNHIMVSANHRAWRHMIALRTSAAAEEEIRFVFFQVFREMAHRYPAIYADAELTTPEGETIPEVRFINDKV